MSLYSRGHFLFKNTRTHLTRQLGAVLFASSSVRQRKLAMKVNLNFFFTIPSLTLGIQVAIEGCCHGELDNIYKHIQRLEREHSYKVDLLLICGDFQAMRNHQDLQCMAAPNKYKALQHFYKWV